MKEYIRTKQMFIVALALFLTIGCKPGDGDNSDTDEGTDKGPISVKTVKIESGTLVRRLGYSGDIEGAAEIRVFSPIPDRIVSITVKEGDIVKAGHVLAVVRSKALSEGVKQAASGLDAVKAQRVSLEDQVQRLRKLKDSGAVTSSQLLNVESQLAAVDAQVSQLKAVRNQARQRKGDAVIRAPIDGVIGQVFLKVGDMAVPQMPICTVVDMDYVLIKVRVPESDLIKLAVGQPVEFSVAASDGDKLHATVSRVSPVLDRLSRTATLEVDMKNTDHSLKPGMLARVDVEVERKENAVWTPKDVLTVTAERKNGKNLYRAVIIKNGTAVERQVLLGLEDGVKVEITEGLEPGENLVIRGQHLLADGDAVNTINKD